MPKLASRLLLIPLGFLGLSAPARAQDPLQCDIRWAQAASGSHQRRIAAYRAFIGACPRDRRVPAANAQIRRLTPPARTPPPRPNRCFTAGGNRTQFVVVRRQSFDRSVLPRLARELGCDRFWFRMGNTTFGGLGTNLIAFSPETPFQQIQMAIRGALAVGARIRFLGCGEDISRNTVWMAHADDPGAGLSEQDWNALQGAQTEVQFIALFQNLGVHLVPMPGNGIGQERTWGLMCPMRG